MRITFHAGGHHCRWPVQCPPLTGVIYLSSLSKQPISVSCHHPNGGFYLNKEKWPKSQGRHSNTGYCQISAHTHLKWDLWDLPQIFRFGVKFLEILFLWGAMSLDSSGPLNDFLNWRKFSWLPHNGLDRVVTHPTTEYNTTFEDWTEANNVLNFHFVIIWSTYCAIVITQPAKYCAICKPTPSIPSSHHHQAPHWPHLT